MFSNDWSFRVVLEQAGWPSNIAKRRAAGLVGRGLPLTMLLVIFGAGASYDSVPQGGSFHQSDYRPPLAQQLFEDRQFFGEVIDHFPRCRPSIPRLRTAVQAGLLAEATLETLLEEATQYPERHNHLSALRFYLRDILWECGDQWLRSCHGLTNYVILLDRLAQWRSKVSEQIRLVTFNYDTLLDSALRDVVGIEIASFEDYTARSDWQLLKPHGSVNWGQAVAIDDASVASTEVPLRVIAAGEVGSLDEWTITSSLSQGRSSRGHPLRPGLAVPMQAKSSFVCPNQHLSALDDALANATKVLVIGWRATERHFLQRFASKRREAETGMRLPFHVVTESFGSLVESRENISSVGIEPTTTMRFGGSFEDHAVGFNGYVRSDHLDALLDE
jgi:hypothetical protein